MVIRILEKKMTAVIYFETYSYNPPEGYELISKGITIHSIDKYKEADLIIGYLHLKEGRIFDVWRKKNNLKGKII